jgi:GH35 family endo-1,4-beta-xylanase
VKFEGFRTARVFVKSVPECIQTFVTANGCNTPGKETRDSKHGVIRTVYTGGRDGTEVELVIVENCDHNWPIPQYGLSASEALWDFFSRHPRRGGVARITIVPPSDGAAPEVSDGTALRAEQDRREQATLAATGPAIEANRKADAVVRVVDAAGLPLAGARVSVAQTGHEFLFGCNIFAFHSPEPGPASLNDQYRQRFAELFNYATTGFYWASYEPRRGQPRYEPTDRVVAWCAERGIRLKGHPLLWGNRAGIPRWSTGQPPPELQRERVTEILARYRGKIGFWEVVNEPSHLPEPTIDEPYRWARQADPSAHLIVNDYMVLADGAPKFFDLLEKAVHAGVPFDGIGIQAHEPRTERFPLDRVRAILDHYATLGKDLHITEFTPTSAGAPMTGAHGGDVWDEAAQADYAVKFYRVAFAHPSVRAITWWDLSDRHSWLPGGGLLRADMSPKPAYEQLKHLIREEWWTALSGQTDARGRYRFRGFRGTYRVTVEARGTTRTTALELTRGQPSELEVSIP